MGRMLEVAVDHVIDDRVERLGRDRAGIEELARGAAFGRMDIDPVVVGPHAAELHALIVRRVEVALLQAPVEKGPVVVPVPVEDPVVEPVVGGRVDLLLHDLGIGLVLVAPRRHLGLHVSGEPRPGLLDQLPLRPPLAVGLFVARVDVVVGKVVGPDLKRLGFRSVRGEAGLHRVQPGRHGSRRAHAQSGRFEEFTSCVHGHGVPYG